MPEDRLQRIEEILQATAILTQQNRQDLVTLTQAVNTNTANIRRSDERMSQFIAQAEADRRAIRDEFSAIRDEFSALRSEIVGIRTELTRINEYLFRQQLRND